MKKNYKIALTLIIASMCSLNYASLTRSTQSLAPATKNLARNLMTSNSSSATHMLVQSVPVTIQQRLFLSNDWKRIKNLDGSTTLTTYDPETKEKIIFIHYPNKTREFTNYNSNGSVQYKSITHPDGVETSECNDENGNLSSTSYETKHGDNHTKLTIHYKNPGLSSRLFENIENRTLTTHYPNKTREFTNYNSNGSVQYKSITHPDGVETTECNDENGNLSSTSYETKHGDNDTKLTTNYRKPGLSSRLFGNIENRTLTTQSPDGSEQSTSYNVMGYLTSMSSLSTPLDADIYVYDNKGSKVGVLGGGKYDENGLDEQGRTVNGEFFAID